MSITVACPAAPPAADSAARGCARARDPGEPIVKLTVGELQAMLDAASARGAEAASKPIEPVLLNVRDSCAALGVSWDFWREHIEPEIRVVRRGARKLIPVAELRAWADRHAEVLR
jgi:hypothetical protein